MAFSFEWLQTPTPTAAQAAGATAFRDLAVDTDGDIYIEDDTGDLAGVSGVDAVISDLRARLETFLGEYQWDTEIGVPYRQEILGQKPSRGRLEEIFRAQCLDTPGIVDVLELTVVRSERTVTITFRATTDLGEVIADTLVVTLQEED